MRICVFCGACDGNDPAYRQTAAAVARSIVRRGMGVVYGGGRVGCMGAVADAALEAGGEVIGVIPEALAAREIAHTGLTALHVVATMHERKAMMADLSDAFIALPGGFGTLEEIFETITWRQLGYYRKPSAFLNYDGYYASLHAFCDAAVAKGFVSPEDRGAVLFGTDFEDLLDNLTSAATSRRSLEI